MMRSYSCFFFAALAFCSCATIVKGTKDSPLTFVSNVKPNTVVLKNERTNTIQEIHMEDNDTLVLKVNGRHRYFKRNKFEITFFRSGFPPIKIELVPKVTFWYWLNIPAGGIWMVIVDPFTGAMYQYEQKNYSISF